MANVLWCCNLVLILVIPYNLYIKGFFLASCTAEWRRGDISEEATGIYCYWLLTWNTHVIYVVYGTYSIVQYVKCCCLGNHYNLFHFVRTPIPFLTKKNSVYYVPFISKTVFKKKKCPFLFCRPEDWGTLTCAITIPFAITIAVANFKCFSCTQRREGLAAPTGPDPWRNK